MSLKTMQGFTAEKAALKAKIADLARSDIHTRLNEGLIRDLDLGRRGDADLPRHRVIVKLSDGIDDAAGASTREETLTRIKEEPVEADPQQWVDALVAMVLAKNRMRQDNLTLANIATRSLLQSNHFEFNRSLRRSYKSQQPGQGDLAAAAPAANVFVHFLG